jgi:hypothetical protein
MSFGFFLANFGTTLLFLAATAVFVVWRVRPTGAFTRRSVQEAREMQEVIQTLVVPEMRGVRESIDATAAELRLFRENLQKGD